MANWPTSNSDVGLAGVGLTPGDLTYISTSSGYVENLNGSNDFHGGSGTEADPYIYELVDTDKQLWVQMPGAHVLIRKCRIDGTSDFCIRNDDSTTHIRVEDCDLGEIGTNVVSAISQAQGGITYRRCLVQNFGDGAKLYTQAPGCLFEDCRFVNAMMEWDGTDYKHVDGVQINNTSPGSNLSLTMRRCYIDLYALQIGGENDGNYFGGNAGWQSKFYDGDSFDALIEDCYIRARTYGLNSGGTNTVGNTVTVRNCVIEQTPDGVSSGANFYPVYRGLSGNSAGPNNTGYVLDGVRKADGTLWYPDDDLQSGVGASATSSPAVVALSVGIQTPDVKTPSVGRRVDVCVHGVGDFPRFAGAQVPAASTFLARTDSSNPEDNPRDPTGETLTGTVYLHLYNPPTDATQVRFYIDGVLHRTEGVAPFSFNGDSQGALNGYSSSALPNGSHTLSWQVDTTSGGASALTGSAVVTVENASSVVFEMDLSSASLNQSLAQAEVLALFPAATDVVWGGVGTGQTYVLDGGAAIGSEMDYDGARGRVLGFRHRANRHYDGTTNSEFLFGPDSVGGGGGYDYVELEMVVRDSSSWSVSNKSLGKRPGLTMVVPGGSPNMDHANESPAHCVNVASGHGASFRHMVHNERWITYGYTDEKPNGECGMRAWPQAPGYDDGSNTNVDCGGIAWTGSGFTGSSLFGDGNVVYQKGVWQTLRQRIRVSTNEIWEYVDGTLVNYGSGGPYSLQSSGAGTLVNGLRLDPYIGSGPSDPHAAGSGSCTRRFHQSSDVWTFIASLKVTALA